MGYRKFREWGIVARNLEGRRIITALGAAVVVAALAAAFVGLVVFRFGVADVRLLILHAVLITVMCAAGLLDDLFPDARPVRGFLGHFGAFFTRGRLTRGATKAILGGAVALFVGAKLSHSGWGEAILNGLLIALSAAVLNLLDVRPGRAVKWWGLAIVLPVLVPATGPMVLPLVVAVLIYAPLDLARLAMLGDAGVLALGASAGMAWCVLLSGSVEGLILRIALVVFLAFVTVYSELSSLSKVIRGNPVLEYFDSLWVGPLETRGEDAIR